MQKLSKIYFLFVVIQYFTSIMLIEGQPNIKYNCKYRDFFITFTLIIQRT